jgi:DNA primase
MPKIEETEETQRLCSIYSSARAAFPNSPAAEYLAGRGIPESLARAAGCGYAAAFEHWELKDKQWVSKGKDRRVIFPVSYKKVLMAIFTRAIDPEYIEPKHKTKGLKSKGVFAAPGAGQAEMPIITEAAIDALSLALAGFPAIATIGTSWPEWLAHYFAFRTVGVAFDADKAGDEAADKLTAELAKMGARAIRLRPSGGKDWNDVLAAGGVQEVRAQVAAALGLEEPATAAIEIDETVKIEMEATCPQCGGPVECTADDRYIYLDCPKGHYAGIEPKTASGKQ